MATLQQSASQSDFDHADTSLTAPPPHPALRHHRRSCHRVWPPSLEIKLARLSIDEGAGPLRNHTDGPTINAPGPWGLKSTRSSSFVPQENSMGPDDDTLSHSAYGRLQNNTSAAMGFFPDPLATTDDVVLPPLKRASSFSSPSSLLSANTTAAQFRHLQDAAANEYGPISFKPMMAGDAGGLHITMSPEVTPHIHPLDGPSTPALSVSPFSLTGTNSATSMFSTSASMAIDFPLSSSLETGMDLIVDESEFGQDLFMRAPPSRAASLVNPSDVAFALSAPTAADTEPSYLEDLGALVQDRLNRRSTSFRHRSVDYRQELPQQQQGQQQQGQQQQSRHHHHRHHHRESQSQRHRQSQSQSQSQSQNQNSDHWLSEADAHAHESKHHRHHDLDPASVSDSSDVLRRSKRHQHERRHSRPERRHHRHHKDSVGGNDHHPVQSVPATDVGVTPSFSPPLEFASLTLSPKAYLDQQQGQRLDSTRLSPLTISPTPQARKAASHSWISNPIHDQRESPILPLFAEPDVVHSSIDDNHSQPTLDSTVAFGHPYPALASQEHAKENQSEGSCRPSNVFNNPIRRQIREPDIQMTHEERQQTHPIALMHSTDQDMLRQPYPTRQHPHVAVMPVIVEGVSTLSQGLDRQQKYNSQEGNRDQVSFSATMKHTVPSTGLQSAKVEDRGEHAKKYQDEHKSHPSLDTVLNDPDMESDVSMAEEHDELVPTIGLSTGECGAGRLKDAGVRQ
ncbi:hypothetical protein BGZ73_008500 [Actinomortierella ambigua]|nr:hypothetical protein BGZ73_008500 [Actinomortierella ambigua]